MENDSPTAPSRKRNRIAGEMAGESESQLCVPKVGQTVYLFKDKHAPEHWESFYQGRYYAARVYNQEEYGMHHIEVGELPGVMIMRPTKEEVIGRMTLYLPSLLRQYFACGVLPPLPSLAYEDCKMNELLEDPSQATFVGDVSIKIDFNLPSEDDVYGNGAAVEGMMNKKALKVPRKTPERQSQRLKEQLSKKGQAGNMRS